MPACKRSPTGPVTVVLASGRRLHVAAKLRCPVAVRARETSRVPVAADRRCGRPEMKGYHTRIIMNLSDGIHFLPAPVSTSSWVLFLRATRVSLWVCASLIMVRFTTSND